MKRANSNNSDSDQFSRSSLSSLSSLSTSSVILDASKFTTPKSFQIHFGISGQCIDYVDHLKLIVVGDQDGYLSLWKYPQLKKISQIKCHHYYISNVKYSPENDQIITTSYDRTIQVHKITRECSLKTVKILKHNNQIESLLVLPKNSLIVSSGPNMSLSLWDLNDFKLKGSLETQLKGGIGQNILYIEKFEVIACGYATGQVTLYDALNGFNEIASVETGHEEWNITLGFDERYNMLYACVDFQCMRCWHISEERNLEYFGEYKFPGSNILSFEPCELDRKEVILMTSVCSKVHVFDIHQQQFSSVFEKPYSRIKILETLKLLILTSNQDPTVDIIDYSSHNFFENNELDDQIFHEGFSKDQPCLME